MAKNKMNVTCVTRLYPIHINVLVFTPWKKHKIFGFKMFSGWALSCSKFIQYCKNEVFGVFVKGDDSKIKL